MRCAVDPGSEMTGGLTWMVFSAFCPFFFHHSVRLYSILFTSNLYSYLLFRPFPFRFLPLPLLTTSFLSTPSPTPHLTSTANSNSNSLPPSLGLAGADSRVPESVVLGRKPGEIFVHRNIANQYQAGDDSAQAVLEYAVGFLGVRHGEFFFEFRDCERGERAGGRS